MEEKSFVMFLKNVKGRFPELWWFTCIYIFGILICAFVVKSTITPFFVFGMYSFPAKDQKHYQTFSLLINGKDLFQYNYPKEKRDILVNNCIRYISIRDNNFTDERSKTLINKSRGMISSAVLRKLFSYPKLNDKEFSNWIYRYSAIDETKIKSLRLVKVTVAFDENGHPNLLSKKTVFDFLYQ